jgi:spermidine/putrescine transport system ATP-binding protein
MKAPILQLRGVSRYFDDFPAVDRIYLDVWEGEFLTIVGPSGSGKTTMARMLVGMDKPTRGDIMLRGLRINDLPANKRPTCMMFQSLALFPHMSVGKNIEFPLKIRKMKKRERTLAARALMEQLYLPADYYDKMVNLCSGGERQRVALARALAFDPEILFFDEPLSALDYRLRKSLEKELKDIQRRTGKTFVYITHSLEEAMVMSDRICIMKNGAIVQVGSPEEIYNNPVDLFVAHFMGEVNSFSVRRREGRLYDLEDNIPYALPPNAGEIETGADGECILLVRPENIRFLAKEQKAASMLAGKIVNRYVLGASTQYQVADGKRSLWVEELGAKTRLNIGDSVMIGWSAEDSRLVRAAAAALPTRQIRYEYLHN